MKVSIKPWQVVLIALGTIVAGGILWLGNSYRLSGRLVAAEWHNAGWMRAALWEYAGRHDGVYPKSLSDLELQSVPLAARHSHDVKSGQERDWLYYPGYTTGSPPETVILASPGRTDPDQRIVVSADGSLKFSMDEDEFVQRLSVQLSRK